MIIRIEAWLKAIFRECLRETETRLGGPIAEEMELLKIYEAASYGVIKVLSDRDFDIPKAEHLRIPEAVLWATHYLKERGWTNPGMDHLRKLVDFKFSFEKEHREFIRGQKRAVS